jgi:hypothetical protein
VASYNTTNDLPDNYKTFLPTPQLIIEKLAAFLKQMPVNEHDEM